MPATPYLAEMMRLASSLYLGLRPGELAGLRWADADFDKGVIRVRGR